MTYFTVAGALTNLLDGFANNEYGKLKDCYEIKFIDTCTVSWRVISNIFVCF